MTHDIPGGGLNKHVDYSRAAENLDFASYNNYPVWGGQKTPLAPHEIAFSLDYIRGLKQQNFWITEAIMGAQGHDVTGFLPRPNQAKMWSWQGIAHGCESMLYFRYRGATKGAEQFCYGILDADNVKGRKFYEVQGLFTEARQYQKAFSSPIKSEVAIVYDYDSLAAFRIQRQSLLLDCQTEMQKLYKPFYDRNIPVCPGCRWSRPRAFRSWKRSQSWDRASLKGSKDVGEFSVTCWPSRMPRFFIVTGMPSIPNMPR